jgi:tetratricopeptide (TPR) repeat protein
VHWQRRELDAAEPLMRASIAARPDAAPMRNNLALLLRDRGLAAEARAEFEAALALDPGYVEARSNLGDTLLREREFGRAVAELERAADDSRAPAETFYTLGLAYERTGRHADALAALSRAFERMPSEVRQMAGELERLLEAPASPATGERIRALREALASQPLFAKCAYRAGQTALLAGRLAEGWAGYHWRPGRLAFERRPHAAGTFETPRLPGQGAGLLVAIEEEQGLGDTLFFLRWAGPLRTAGARLMFRGDARLQPILERTGHFDACVPPDAPWPRAPDCVRTAGDLPLAAGEPGYPPPLTCEPLPERIRKARSALEGLDRPMAVTWRAGTRSDDPYGILFKEVEPGLLANALGDRAAVSVQRRPAPGETEALGDALGRPVLDLSSWNEDLEDALALMAVVDDYAGVSNTNMHLRAVAGRTARVLVPFPPEWRWLAAGESAWFPGFRVVRQAWDGRWPAMLYS